MAKSPRRDASTSWQPSIQTEQSFARGTILVLALAFAASYVAAYIACFRPNWFLSVLICIPVVLGFVVTMLGGDGLNISMGSVTLRTTDPGTLGLLIGILYHARSGGLRQLRRQPGGAVLRVIIVFLVIKVLATIMFGGNSIASNALANTLGGGLAAALGEVRDDLLAVIVPMYVIVSSRHLKLSRMVVPFLTAIGIILVKALLTIVDTGQIWSSTAEFRFIHADDAIELTFLSFVIFFFPAAARRQRFFRFAACIAFIIALVANHRSQWLASILGVSVLLFQFMAGKLTRLKHRQSRVVWIMAFPIAIMIGLAIMYSGNQSTLGSDTTGIGTRALAFTDPASDPDSKWRMALWLARIEEANEHWIGGRFLGVRPLTLVNGRLLGVPNHNAYLTAYELGGVLLLGLVIALWGALVIEAIKRMRAAGPPSITWAPAVALSVVSASLAFGVAYDFPLIGPALATVLLLREPNRPLSIHGFTGHSKVPVMQSIRLEASRTRGA